MKKSGCSNPKLHPAPPDADAAKQAAELVTHLRPSTGCGGAGKVGESFMRIITTGWIWPRIQLDQLITHPNQPQRRVVQWLNKLADLQVRHGANYDTVRATLQPLLSYPVRRRRMLPPAEFHCWLNEGGEKKPPT